MSSLVETADDDNITSGQSIPVILELPYEYEPDADQWQRTRHSFRQSTATITSTGAGTALDMSNTPMGKLSMSLTGQTNTGTFTSCTVDLQASLDNTNWRTIMTMTLASATTDIDVTEFPTLYLRYNVTALSIAGDADLDITIAAVGR